MEALILIAAAAPGLALVVAAAFYAGSRRARTVYVPAPEEAPPPPPPRKCQIVQYRYADEHTIEAHTICGKGGGTDAYGRSLWSAELVEVRGVGSHEL